MSKTDIPIFFFEETESTNLVAREYAKEDPSPAFFVARRQTGGMGRKGRSFVSPEGGIYMSFVFSPEKQMRENILRLTTASCVAVCRSIKKTCDIETDIKWVNDIYYKGKKVCGILTQSVTGENGEIKSVIIGIGINFSTPEASFPEELRDIAGSLYNGVPTVKETDLTETIAKELPEVISLCATGEYLDEYRKRSMVIGRKVRCFRGDEVFTGEAVDIDENGGLIVSTEENGLRTLSSGEITLRLCEEK